MLLLAETTDPFLWHTCPFPNKCKPTRTFSRCEWSLFQGRPYLHQNTVFIKMFEVGRKTGTYIN